MLDPIPSPLRRLAREHPMKLWGSVAAVLGGSLAAAVVPHTSNLALPTAIAGIVLAVTGLVTALGSIAVQLYKIRTDGHSHHHHAAAREKEIRSLKRQVAMLKSKLSNFRRAQPDL